MSEGQIRYQKYKSTYTIYWKTHKKQMRENHRKWIRKNRDIINKRRRLYYQQNKEKMRFIINLWHKNNPRSNRSESIELQSIMNNIRKRDNNTCQWFGCRLTHKDSPIHVHHIFPRSEYPELELIEQYMICYCANHHGLFHRYRGDSAGNLLSRQLRKL